MANLFQPSLTRAIDSNGNPISGARMYFYATGTSTLATVYTDEAGLIASTNPVVSGSAGLFDPVYLDPAVTYRVVQTDSTGASIVWDIDPVRGLDESQISDAVAASLTSAQTAATAAAADATAADAARVLAEAARDGAVAAQSDAEDAVSTVTQYGSAKIKATWVEAAAGSYSAGDAVIVFTDAGTHTDPVVGGTVNNAGIYLYRTSPAGLERVADTEAVKAQTSAAAAATSATNAAASAAILASQSIEPFTINGTGAGNASAPVFYWASSITSSDRWLTSVTVDVSTSGTFRIIVAKVNGDGTLDLYSNTGVALTTSSKTASNLEIYVPATYVVGIQRGTGQMLYQSGTIPLSLTQWQSTSIPTTSTAKTTTTANGVKWHPTFTPEVAFKARDAYTTASATETLVGATSSIGWPETIVATGSNAPTNYSIVIQSVLGTGRISNIKLGANASGTATFSIVTMSGTTVTVVSQVSYSVTAGVNNIPVNIATTAGQYLAVTLTGLKFQLNSNPTGQAVWAKTGTLATGNTLTSESAHRFEVIATTKTGLVADVAGSATAVNDGGGLIAAADKNGVTDATSIFSTAKAAHPEPYIDPGTYAVTAVPAKGGGLWGPGVVNVNGQRLFLPPAPQTLTLLEKLRAEMMEHICNNDVLTLIGDSISQYVYPGNAGTRADHYLNRLTRFVNMGVALDEPGESALRPDTGAYVPTWNGITTSGTVSSGTNGPLGVSLVLAAGASISFTGAYESVAVHYQAASGAGLLTYAYNGSSFATTDANAAAENDAFSGLKTTGQTASGTYTITASGGSVEITNLIRLGVKTAGPLNRLLTQRVARGGYTFSSYVASARTTSILKIGSWAGGKAVPILALGINDSFTIPTATIVSNATTIIDALVAGGVPRIYAIPPMRPTSAWDGNYTGGRTFEPASAALRRLYRQKGVKVIPMDGIDWNGEGLFNDGLHTGVAGNQVQAQILIEALASS